MKKNSSKANQRRTIALITPWFGRDLTGGAELHAWNVACKLAERGFSLEVLTTCCKAYGEDWATNHLEEGLSEAKEGFSIRRFPVGKRDRTEFDRVCGQLIHTDIESLKPGVSPVSKSDELIFRDHLINCESLLSFIEAHSADYAAFLFIPYLYGPILQGIPLVASRSVLLPCLHNEAYAYLQITQNIFFQAKHILWLSQGEYELGLKLYGPGIIGKSVIAGAGIETNILSNSGPVLPRELDQGDRYILYLGRKDKGKGTHFLIDAFKEFQKQSKTPLSLVLAGPGSENFNDVHHGILDLGFVNNELRQWLLKNCLVLAQPSKNESFSRVIFEAWFFNKPVIARRSCLATASAVQTSGGGWIAEDPSEWIEIIKLVDQETKHTLDKIGDSGRRYSLKVADWTNVIDQYATVLEPMSLCQTENSRFKFKFKSLVNQTITIHIGEDQIGTCTLKPNQISKFDLFSTHLYQRNQILRFETSVQGTEHPPDPRTLGFNLIEIIIENKHLPHAHIVFKNGWNRSEGSNNSPVPRWSTGHAEISFTFSEKPANSQSVHQVLPNLGYGDAIGNHTVWIRDRLQSQGYHSEIYAKHVSPEMISESFVYSSPDLIEESAAVIYHHSIGSEITPWVCEHKGPKALIYHNITPPKYFAPYSKEFASFLERGHEELRVLAKYFPISAGDSKFNAEDLKNSNFRNPVVVPLSIDPSKWAFQPDEAVMSQFQDGRTNIIFIGRVVPNKRHEELIYFLKFWLIQDPNARLIIVGTDDITSTYLKCLNVLAKKLRVDHAVVFTGHVNDAQLLAYYRCASIFLCLSEHEGFCVPVVEAMWFDIPVIAYDCTAVGDTMGDAGILIKDKSRPDLLAEQLFKQLTNPNIVEEIISKQRQRRSDFLPESNGNNIDNLIKILTRESKITTPNR